MARLPIGTSGNVEYDPKTYEVWIYETCKNKSSKKCGQKVWRHPGKLQQMTISQSNGPDREILVFCLKPGTQYFCKPPSWLGLSKDMIDGLINFQVKGLSVEICYFPEIPQIIWNKINGVVSTGNPSYDGYIRLSKIFSQKVYNLFGNGDEYQVPISSFIKQTFHSLRNI